MLRQLGHHHDCLLTKVKIKSLLGAQKVIVRDLPGSSSGAYKRNCQGLRRVIVRDIQGKLSGAYTGNFQRFAMVIVMDLPGPLPGT